MNPTKIIATTAISALVLLGSASAASAGIPQNEANPCEGGPVASEWCGDQQPTEHDGGAKPSSQRPKDLAADLPENSSSVKVKLNGKIAPRPARPPRGKNENLRIRLHPNGSARKISFIKR